MLTGIIQILALIVLYFLLRRASKLDLAKELELKNHIHTEIKNAVTVICSSINALERNLDKHIDGAQNRIIGESHTDYLTLRDCFRALAIDVDVAYNSVSSSLITLAEKQYPELISRLEALEAPLSKVAEAQLSYTVKDGEARRTLYNRIQERDKALAHLRKYVEDLQNQCKVASENEQVMKDTARTYLADLNREISFIHAWMGEKGMPVTALDKALSAEFKGEIPSQIYQRVQSEKLLSETIKDAANA